MSPPTQSAPLQSKFLEAFEHHRHGRLAQADIVYQDLLERAPDHVDGLHFRGLLLHQGGRHPEALELIQKAIALDPGQAAAHSNLGVVFLAMGRSREAVECLDRALALNPGSAESWTNRGNACGDLKQYEEALASYAQALAINPHLPEALMRRGRLMVELRRLEDALASYDRALDINPADSGAHSDRGGVLIEMKRYEDAVASLQRALALDPDNLAALSNLGAALVELKRQTEALVSLDRALMLNPNSVNALFNRGTALRDLKRPQEAAGSYARLLAIDAGYPYAAGFLLNSKRKYCDWSDHAGSLARLESAVLECRRVDEPFSFLAISSSPAAQLRCAQTWVADKCPETADSRWNGPLYRHARIRIAYLSADFSDHPVAFSVAELFETHDRSKFEVLGVSFGPDNKSEIRKRLERAVDRFIDVRGKSDREVAQQLRDLEVDIAVDLNGFTQGNRAVVFAQRAAPVQVNYLGYSGTMGADYMDYIIGDACVIPHGHEPFYGEKVVRLPDSFLVNDRKRATAGPASSREQAGLPPEGFVFCCFNHSYKITPAVFDIWMRVLAGTAGSVLWLFEDNATAPANLRREAEMRGIAGQRIVFARRAPQLSDHLARYGLADLFLDTLPYNAHVTTVDALWSGLPVLTCMGSTFDGRVAASLLHAAGLPDLVTHTSAEYEALALRLAAGSADIGKLKARLTENRSIQPLFDTDRFRRHIEKAYSIMHERSQRSLPPEAFDVTPLG